MSEGEDVRARRRKLGLSREQLAVRAGVAASTVKRMEEGLGCQRASVAAVERALRIFEAERR